MQTFILTLVGEARVVVPRRVVVDVRPGEGRLRLPDAPTLDDEWRASVQAAWDAAVRLTGARDVDAEARVVGPQALVGGSAGLPLGLAFVAALRGRPLPPHFATGAVVDADGRLEGGAAAPEKGRAAAGFARQMAMGDWRFLAPMGAPEVPDVPLVRVPDLRRAVAALDAR